AGGLAGLASSVLALPLPGQTAAFLSEPLAEPLQIIGSSRVRLQVSSDRPVRDAVLFASLRIADAGQRQILPNGLVAPIRLADLGPEPVTVEVDLPAVVTEAAAGDRLAVVVGTTDQAYRLPEGPAVYTVTLAEGEVLVPQVDVESTVTESPAWLWPVGGVALVLLIVVVTWLLRPRHRDDAPDADPFADVPIRVDGLVKRFKGGLTAVDGATFTVPPGVVLGLLGPNGAGKTTTMRMIMGLIRPTDGEVRVFGERILPGSSALARIGSFVEGPGFLPYLSGRRNLELYWRASGRVGQEPYFDEVLEIAGLGSAVDRKVKTYSQGMRQRLGIAQAMLGMPDVLLLDEPTNGLDPPQIREMRDVLHAYAATGRTVIISSHLLSEVEQTCSHVVVMHRGHVIAEGTVEEFMRGRTGQRLEDVFLEMVGEGHTVVSS
ncbi:MAG: ATP-binding cassette domain-containing protein, partial [bacterium]